MGTFCCIRVNIAVHVIASAMIDSVMRRKLVLESFVRLKLICDDSRLTASLLRGVRFESMSCDIRNDSPSQLPITLYGNEYCSLARAASAF